MAGALLLAFGGSPILYYGTEVRLEPAAAITARRPGTRCCGAIPDPELLPDFKRLIAARRSHPALIYGDVVTLSLDNERGLWL